MNLSRAESEEDPLLQTTIATTTNYPTQSSRLHAAKRAAVGLITLFVVLAFVYLFPWRSPPNGGGDAARAITGGGGMTPDDTPRTTASPLVYRPLCEYWNAPNQDDDTRAIPVFQEGIQTSMTAPSQQWSPLACFPAQPRPPPVAQGGYGFFSASQQQGQKASPDTNGSVPTSPLTSQVNHFQAPDAILQVDFSTRAFADRPPIYGFGGAFTEASALNYNQLSTEGKDAVMELLFGKTGLGYSLGRIPINSCDFSVESYSFDDVDGDFELNHFDMGLQHDVESGMVDMALRAVSVLRNAWGTSSSSTNDDDDYHDSGVQDGNLLLMVSPWSPPSWMKAPTPNDNETAVHAETMVSSAEPVCVRDGVGPTSPYAAAWALYFSKFLTAYSQLGLPIWAVTVQNEPEFAAPWEACSFTPELETEFVAHHLGPRLAHDHPTVKLFVFDHNKDHINDWTNVLLNATLGARDYVNGIAYHWYAGGMDRLLDGALGIPNMHRLQATLRHEGQDEEEQELLLGSESCHCPSTGYAGGDIRVAWDRAERYAHTVLADLAAGSNGWTEWNLILDSIGGPNHLGNVCESTLLAAPHRARNANNKQPLPPFEKSHPLGDMNVGDGRTREELHALGFPAKYLDVGVVVQPIYYYMGHISRYVRPGSYSVPGLVTSSSASSSSSNEDSQGGGGRIFRPKGSVVAGGGENNLAREGIEITLWPCEGSTRQMFDWEFEQSKHITVRGHDWLGRPTKSCIASDVDPEFLGLRLVSCDSASAGIFNVVPVSGSDEPGSNDDMYKIMLLNHPSSDSQQCLTILELANNGGANGPLGGAQVVLGDCDTDPSAIWNIDAQFGEASSTFFGDQVCMTTGWPFLQMGAFVTPRSNKKTVVLLNEATLSANFVLQDQDNVLMTSSIPARSIQTFVLS